MSVIANASAESLHAFVAENIEQGSQLITDDWSGFSGIESKGYTRQIHVQKYADDEDKMLPHVHTIVSLLKRWLLGTHQGAVDAKHLQAYLDEYVFRFNRRKSAQRGLLFYRLLESAMRTKTVTYKDLTDHNI
jgi:transposase-like protein